MKSDEGYAVRLSKFEGPLDLLLHLVHEAQIDLRDIFVSHITDQYLQYMRQVDEVDLERACEFLRMASLLVFIKSRSLLPQQNEEADTEQDQDPEQLLIENLRLYELYKKASVFLRHQEEAGQQFLTKLPEDLEELQPDRSGTTSLAGDAQALLKAFAAVLERKNRNAERGHATPVMQIRADTWSVAAQKRKIMHIVQQTGGVQFTDFFPEDAESAEIAVTFCALLELWNAEEVAVHQLVPFGPITVDAVDNVGINQDAG